MRKRPTMETRRRLMVAGAGIKDVEDRGFAIVNAFFRDDRETANEDRWVIHTDYWETMVCVLARRAAIAERQAEVELKRYWDLKLGLEESKPEAISEEWLAANGFEKHLNYDWLLKDSDIAFNVSRAGALPGQWTAFLEGMYLCVDLETVDDLVRLLKGLKLPFSFLAGSNCGQTAKTS